MDARGGRLGENRRHVSPLHRRQAATEAQAQAERWQEEVIRVLPGRIAVLWELEPEGLIHVPDAFKMSEANRKGIPATKTCTVLASGMPGIGKGDLVAVRMDAAGLILDKTDYSWVPDGFEVRIYGVTEPLIDRAPDAHPENDVLFAKVS